MNRSRMMQIVIGVGLLVILGQTVYTGSDIEQVIITQFGEPSYEQTMDPSTLFILGTDSEVLRFLDGTPKSWSGSSPCRLSRHVRRGSTHS